jgi:hypothetical protein
MYGGCHFILLPLTFEGAKHEDTKIIFKAGRGKDTRSSSAEFSCQRKKMAETSHHKYAIRCTNARAYKIINEYEHFQLI